jgi:hypothetical protein
MFRLPRSYLRQMLEEGTEERPINDNNEVAKGFHFEDQARVNTKFEGRYPLKCMALDEICTKEGCVHFTRNTGKLEDGWACREYAVDFPDAPFDSRHHVTIVGLDKPDFDATMENVRALTSQGAKDFCMYCYTPYATKPGHSYNGGWLEICPCGSDLFMGPDQFIEILEGWKKKDNG